MRRRREKKYLEMRDDVCAWDKVLVKITQT
jgi:hypothetical protein